MDAIGALNAQLPYRPGPVSALIDPVSGSRFHPRGQGAESTTFLLDATRVLAESLDLETTLATVARLSLPHLGSWCIVDLCEGEELRRVAIIHSDPSQQALADALLSGWPPHREDPRGLPSAALSRRTEVVYPVTEEMLISSANSPENLAILRALQIGSILTVPLLARGAVLGAITYVAPNHGDSFSRREQVLAEDLATRCAMAIDNARLFHQAQHAQEAAEAANLVKMRFLSTMSHELRTPLNAIAGYVQLLEGGIRGPLLQQQLTDILRIGVNQRHLLGLVEAVLNYARVDSGRVEFGLENVPLERLLADSEMLVSPLAESRSISIEGCGATAGPGDLVVFADREKLQQILVNLLTNAIKFSPDGETVGVVCRGVGNGVEISVSDRGAGIAPEHLERIFEPFVQVDEGLKRRHGGIGLGLAISRELARGMGSELVAQSEAGRGSTFTLTLPRRRG